jgi:hypothetical protein
MALIGDQRPRLYHIPTYSNLDVGVDAVEYAKQHGLVLDDWQDYSLVNMMARDADDLWTSFEVKLTVSRQNGKGSIYEARELFGLFCYPSDRLLIHTAHEHKTSSEHFQRIWWLIETNPDLLKQVVPPNGRHSTAYGREFIEVKAKPTIILGPGGKHIRKVGSKRLIFIARSASSGRGFTGDFIAYDEDMILDAGKIGASLPSLSARPNPQVVYAGSAGDKKSTQAAKVRRRGLAGNSDSLLYLEWSADICDEYCDFDCDKHDDPDDEATVAKANPAYGIRITPRFITKERDAFEGNEIEWYRERLGVGEWPADSEGWAIIPEKWWNITKDRRAEPERVIHPVFAVDIALDRGSAAISVAGIRGSDNRTGIQIVEYKNGTGWLLERIKTLHAKWKPVVWIIDKRASAGSLITELEKAEIPVETLQAAEVAHASGMLFDAFRDDTVRHYGQSSFRTAMAGADWRKLSESRAFDRVNSGADITPLMAAAFAHWGFMSFGDDGDYDAADSVYFNLDRIIQLFNAGHYGLDDIRRLYERGIIDEDDLEALAKKGISL